MSAVPYHVEVDDETFNSFVPIKIRQGVYVDHGQALSIALPMNALISKVGRLTKAINANANFTSTYTMIRIVPLKTSSLDNKNIALGDNASSITDAEVSYHRSGKAFGKVLLVQITVYDGPPFLRMTYAKVVRDEPEDALILMSHATKSSLVLDANRRSSTFSQYDLY